MQEIIAKNREIFYKSELEGNRLIPDVSPEFEYGELWQKL